MSSVCADRGSKELDRAIKIFNGLVERIEFLCGSRKISAKELNWLNKQMGIVLSADLVVQPQTTGLGTKPLAQTRVQFGNYVLDIAARSVTRDGQPVEIRNLVMRVLIYLAQRPNRAVEKQELFEDIWDGSLAGIGVVANAICLLRRIVEPDPKHPRYIQTVHRGYGYRFYPDGDAAKY